VNFVTLVVQTVLCSWSEAFGVGTPRVPFLYLVVLLINILAVLDSNAYFVNLVTLVVKNVAVVLAFPFASLNRLSWCSWW
jgi:hypothetical protein